MFVVDVGASFASFGVEEQPVSVVLHLQGSAAGYFSARRAWSVLSMENAAESSWNSFCRQHLKTVTACSQDRQTQGQDGNQRLLTSNCPVLSPPSSQSPLICRAMRSAGLAFAARTCWRNAASPQSRVFRPQALTSYRRHMHGDNGARRSIAKLLEWKPQEKASDVVVTGFIRSVRSMKSRSFVALGDGSSLAPLQAIVPMNQAEGCDSLFSGASVSNALIVAN